METLTVFVINSIRSSVNKDLKLHPTTIAYLQSLIEPYALALDSFKHTTAIDDIAAIYDWCQKNVINVENELGTTFNTIRELKAGLTEGPDFLNEAKKIIIKRLIKQRIANLSDLPFLLGDPIALPWDLIHSARFMVETDKLPVEITMDGQSYFHMFTEEFTMGLLLYSSVANKNFIVSMFGIPFHSAYLDSSNDTRYTNLCRHMRANFSVEMIYSLTDTVKQYCFFTTEFMQGFSTGALWYQDDHRKYWKNLQSYQESQKVGTPLSY